jgi:hypothetical protein
MRRLTTPVNHQVNGLHRILERYTDYTAGKRERQTPSCAKDIDTIDNRLCQIRSRFSGGGA